MSCSEPGCRGWHRPRPQRSPAGERGSTRPSHIFSSSIKHFKLSSGQWTLVALAIFVTAGATLLMMGRVPICTCGYVKPWHGIVASSENSQHLSDWYTFSHVIHGFAFYGLFWLVAPRSPLAFRLAAATLLEASWEIVENTDLVINRYREATVSLDYYGDSVINSMADILSMVAGFVVASRLRLWVVVALTAALETFVAWMIRDNLTLNIIMLLYPLDAIREWQAGR